MSLSAPRLPLPAIVVATTLVAALAGVRTADAQWQASLRMGVTGSTLTGDTDSDFSAVTRLSGGAALSYVYASGFAIEPGLNYVVKGANVDGEIQGLPGAGGAVPVEATFELAYLEVPVFLSYVFERRGSIHPKIFGGPIVAFNLDSQVTYRAKAGGPEFSDSDDSVENRDLAFGAGLGVEWEIGGERLLLGVQSTFGLSNARTAEPPLYNRSLSFFTGIVF
ncbi:MAG: PorT family protein [Rhodothermales bacterium]|nr:PorT family protein [Rhodothermales bacterium]